MYLEIDPALIPSPAVMFARRREIQFKFWGPPRRNFLIPRFLPASPPPPVHQKIQKQASPDTMPPTHDDDQLPDWLCLPPGPITLHRIIWLVSAYYQVRVSDLTSSKRFASIVRPRQVAAYLARRLTSRSTTEIGKRLGGRDHTTIIHAVRAIDKHIQHKTSLAQDIQVLDKTLRDRRDRYIRLLDQSKTDAAFTSHHRGSDPLPRLRLASTTVN